ncbi:MAG: alpha/beta fold hydrolase [Candidatus Thorarchaeota archaeon]|nr:alpha/beta fold hydrolase [Candidatus Thorarchaeota archaeon]
METLKQPDRKKQLFLLCLVLIGSSALLGHGIQNNFGSIDVEYIRIIEENGLAIAGKLYRPLTATNASPAPAVLLLHGMNNDKDTEGPAALELAKRGVVALALDELSHGDSDRIIDVMGYLSGESLQTLGGNAAYQWLKSLGFVDAAQIGLVGHSMGASTASAIADLNPNHRAIAIQADGPYNLTEHDYMNNYLAIWSFYEELFTTQARTEFLADSLEMIAYNEDLSGPDAAEVDYTYGSFADGSAHRYAKSPCTHPGATWNQKGVAEITAWMLQALMGQSESDAWAVSAVNTQTYMIGEWATLFALIVSVLSLIPLAGILLEVPYFNEIARPLPKKIPTKSKKWWAFAILNAVIAGVTYLILPNIGMTLGVIVGTIAPIFLLVTGNGLLLWFLVNAIIAWVFFRFWFKKESNKEDGISYPDVGRFKSITDHANRDIIFKTILLSAVLFGYLYILVSLSQFFLGIEFRYMWPVFKSFTPERFGQFLVYLLPVLPFFLINGGVFAYGMLRQPEYDSPIKTQLIWWIKIVFAMESVLLIMILVNYLPMFLLGTGPILLMGLYGIFLMAYLPLFAGIFFIMTAFYQQTGRIYLGAVTATLIVVWIMTAGMLI